MTPDPRVAVVIPCFNDGRFLGEALASVGEQEPCEVLVVDDGSTDAETLAVLARLERAGTRVLRQANGGLSAARMAGVHATRAPYVHPLDSDDRLAPGALTALADALDADPGLGAVWGDLETFGARRRRHPKADLLDPWRVSFLDELPATAMLRRTALEATGGWTLRDAYEDWDLWMRAAAAGVAGRRVPQVTYRYREHGTPRMYLEGLRRHDELRALLRSRNAALYAARGEHRRRSPAPASMKLLFPLIDRLPGLPAARKELLMVLVRDRAEPHMRAEDFPTTAALARKAITRAVAGLRRAGAGDPG